MPLTADQAKHLLFDAMNNVQSHPELGDDWIKEVFPALVDSWRPADYLYEPSPALTSRIRDYVDWCELRTEEDAGKLMEEIALLAFTCLKGFDSLKSYQSYSAQLDLVISGTELNWRALMHLLRLDWKYRTVVIEAKNQDEKVDDKQFTRFCGILLNNFDDSSQLGVFVTRSGATGFPQVSDSDGKEARQRTLKDAQATQIIFHARTGKYVIVLDHNDLLRLNQPGALPAILEAKIRAVETWTGLPVTLDEKLNEIDLPPHLLKHRPAQGRPSQAKDDG